MVKNHARVLTGEQVLDSANQFEAVIPYPYSSNIEIGPTGHLEPRLSVMSSIAIDAAATAWQPRPGSTIVIPGETPFPDYPNTSDLMEERAAAVFGVPLGAMIPLYRLQDGRRGFDNTYLQAEGLREYFDGNADGVLVTPLNYHIRRVMGAFEAYGLSPNFATAESVLHAAGNHEYDDYLPIIAGLEKSERVLRFINRIDKKGRLFNLVTRLQGPRIVDIIEVEEGRLELEDDNAHKKRKRLEAQIKAATQTKTA